MLCCRRLALNLICLGLLVFIVAACLESDVVAQLSDDAGAREFRVPTDSNRIVLSLERKTTPAELPPRVDVYADGRVVCHDNEGKASGLAHNLDFIVVEELLRQAVSTGLLEADSRELARRQRDLTREYIDDAPIFIYDFSVDAYRLDGELKDTHAHQVGLIAPILFKNSEAFMADPQMRTLVELAETLEGYRQEASQ